MGMLGFTVPLLLLVTLVLGSLSKDVLVLMLGNSGIEALSLYVVSMYMHLCECVYLCYIVRTKCPHEDNKTRFFFTFWGTVCSPH